jgi:DNA-directed RNA polymerase specialized sigma24 family protein
VPAEGSITGLIERMRSGNDMEAQLIWSRYSPRLAALARQRLPRWLLCAVDGDDLANSAIKSVILGLHDGRFPELHDRDGLWALLACITVRKARREINRASTKKRLPLGRRQPLDEAIEVSDPSPDLALVAAERFELLIKRLREKDEVLGTIALLKLEGYTNEQIARQIRCSCRRVYRKLELIRTILEAEEED